MRKLALLVAAAVTLLAAALSATEADAGCFRLGLTGYHWYHFCAGPALIYPHHRVCRNGNCWCR